MKESLIRRRTAILFSVTILLISLIGLILVRLGSDYMKLEQQRRNLRDILINTERVESLGKEIWGATRGYVIAGEDDFLKPVHEAEKKIQEPLDELKNLSNSMPEIRSQVALLSGIVDERIEVSHALMLIRKEQGFEAARTEVLSRRGEVIMDNLKSVSQQVKELAHTELEELRKKHDSSLDKTLSVFFVLLGCVIFILIIAFIFINRAYSGQARARQDLEDLNTELDKKIRDRTKELRLQVDQFHTLTESLPQIIWTAEPNGVVDYVNHQWTEFTGHPVEIARSEEWVNIIHPEDRAAAAEQWIKAVKDRRTYEVEYRIKREDDVYCWFLVRAYPLKDDFGNVYKWVGSCTDIDEHKKQLEMKDEFISLTSHELRTPITTIKAYVQLIERCIQEDIDCDAVEYLKKTHIFVDRLGSIVNDLHETTKAQAGKLQLRKSSFNFEECIREMITALQQTNNQHRITLSGAADVTVWADRARLEQVFTNYISNAIKYSPGADKVLVNLSIDKDYVIVAIRDFGIGIPSDKIDKIFNRFFRAANTGSIEGLGLGLFLSRKIIGAHGGKVWVESEEGKGSTFFFCIPVNSKS